MTLRKRRIVADLESDGLLHQLTKIHCLGLRDVDTSETWVFRNNAQMDNIAEGIAILNDAAVIIGANWIDFDSKALYQIYGDLYSPTGITRDTLVLTRMLFADEKERDFKRWRRGTLEGKLIGSHELKAWGQRLEVYKGDYADVKKAQLKEQFPDLPKEEINRLVWAEWSQEMEDYMIGDLDVTQALWKKCETTIAIKDWSEQSILLEHTVHEEMGRVQDNGFPFNVEEARQLENDLRHQHETKSAVAVEHFGIWWRPCKWIGPESKAYIGPDGNKITAVFQPRSIFGEDGSRVYWGEVQVPKRTTRFKPAVDKETGEPIYKGDTEAGCPFTPVELNEFNPNSRTQIINRLMKIYGWEPQEFTEKGQAMVNDDILRELAGAIPICEDLAEIFYYKKRLGQLVDGKNGLIGKALERADNKIHPRIIVGGTVTNRASHSNPNIAQVPRVVVKKLPLLNNKGEPMIGEDGKPILAKEKTMLKGRAGDHGWDFRSLFHVPNGWVLMGADQKGIELRALGHYMAEFDGGEYMRLVVESDPHDLHQRVMELDSRDTAKTFIYACVPMDTTVLTRRGWKKHNELILGEDVMSYNAKKKIKEWAPLLEVVRYDDAPLVHISNEHNTFDVKCTPNHRWFIKRRGAGRKNIRSMVDEVRAAEDLNTECSIIMNAPMSSKQDKATCGLDILASPKYNTDWVQQVLDMSQVERSAFLSGFLIADGYYVKWKNKGNWKFNQLKGNLSEAAQLAAYLVSENSISVADYKNDANSKPMVDVNIRNKPHVTMQKMKTEKAGRAPVFCIRTKNESFVMRQGRTITITGNTIYGAAGYKLGITADPSLVMHPARAKALGEELRKRLMVRIPAMGQVVKAVQREAKRGYVDGMDGRLLYVRSKHAALNTKLQGCAASLAKQWCVLFEQMCEDDGLVSGWNGDFAILAWIHDELQAAVRDDPKIIEICRRNVIAAASEAGKILNFRGAIDIDVKFGKTWSDTH